VFMPIIVPQTDAADRAFLTRSKTTMEEANRWVYSSETTVR
jgi:hypothetical protein